jgi:hypothetical protein
MSGWHPSSNRTGQNLRTALMNPTQRDKHPVFAKRFDALLAELRETYDLAGS